jgi:hypothetical protein
VFPGHPDRVPIDTRHTATSMEVDMPAPAIPVIQARTGYLYDGTNSADLAAAIFDFTVVSETATTLTFTSNGVNLTVPRGGYVVEAQGMVVAADIFANADDFADAYVNVREAVAHKHEIVLKTGPGKPLDSDEYPADE